MRTGGRRRGKDYSIVLCRLMVRCDLAERSPFHTSQSMRIGRSFIPLKETGDHKEALSLLSFLEGSSTQAEVLAVLLEQAKEQQVKAGSLLSLRFSF